jgi:hypothetical protein
MIASRCSFEEGIDVKRVKVVRLKAILTQVLAGSFLQGLPIIVSASGNFL